MAGPRLPVSARLQRLEARVWRAERRLRAALGLRGRLRALERRLSSAGVWAPLGQRENVGGLRAPEGTAIRIKEEEEPSAVDRWEGEVGEAPGEPFPEPSTFHQPSNPTKKDEEMFAEELPGAGGEEDIPKAPDAGLQKYSARVFSWIKEEEGPRCPEGQDLEKEELPTGPNKAHGGEPTKRDPLADDGFESTPCRSEVPGEAEEKFSKDPGAGVTWDSQWNSEAMETSTPGNGLGGDAQYERGFAEHLDFLSAQENGVGRRPCVQGPPGDILPGSTCEKTLTERMFHLLHPQPRAPGEKEVGQEVGPTTREVVARSERGHNPTGATKLGDLGGEEHPPTESDGSFATALRNPCWDHLQEKSESCAKCRQPSLPRGSAAAQPQGQARGKSYICSDCGKSFVCHSWLVRHQTTHTGERPYKCSECDKSYRRKDYLLNHQRRHSGEGLFQCPLCRKRFVLRRSLVKHQESHMQGTHLTLGGWSCAANRGSVMHSI